MDWMQEESRCGTANTDACAGIWLVVAPPQDCQPPPTLDSSTAVSTSFLAFFSMALMSAGSTPLDSSSFLTRSTGSRSCGWRWLALVCDGVGWSSTVVGFG
jgi:hypothetical protein